MIKTLENGLIGAVILSGLVLVIGGYLIGIKYLLQYLSLHEYSQGFITLTIMTSIVAPLGFWVGVSEL